jgi:hypothetical protein
MLKGLFFSIFVTSMVILPLPVVVLCMSITPQVIQDSRQQHHFSHVIPPHHQTQTDASRDPTTRQDG